MYKIYVAEPFLGKEELKNVIKVVKSGWISSKGEFIEKFEKSFAEYSGARYGVATSNGTTALHLALAALGIGKGDEIIVPTLTFIATANVVKYCNARPVFVDSHPEYWCLDPEDLEEKITSRTKAIIPVHLYGHPCDMDPILDIARDKGLYIIEDAAEAHGAMYKGQKVGSFGDVSCFSFYGNKIITTGEGGMCLTNNEELMSKMRLLRDHGMSPEKRYWHDVIGFNYRMTNIQAAIGMAQLKKIDSFLNRKRQIAKWYNEKLRELIENEKIVPQTEMPWAKCVYWMYSVLITDTKINRNELIRYLEINGIETRPFFYPVHEMPPYRGEAVKLKVAERLSRQGLNLPTSVKLGKKEIFHISKKFLEFFNTK